MRCVLGFTLLCLSSLSWADALQDIETLLDRFHQAASEADSVAYFDTMTTDVVFLGTDASERWVGQAFRDFSGEYFAKGKGWTYTPTTRNVSCMGVQTPITKGPKSALMPMKIASRSPM